MKKVSIFKVYILALTLNFFLTDFVRLYLPHKVANMHIMIIQMKPTGLKE
jgi:hypothetical protein